MALTGRGDLWVAGFALGLADGSAWTAFVVGLAAVGALARVGSAGLADLAGAQGVLGGAGLTGTPLSIAGAWCSSLGLLLVGRQRSTGIVLGATAGLLVAGPTPVGDGPNAAAWVLSLAVGAGAGWLAVARASTGKRARWQMVGAVALGALGAGFGLATHFVGAP